MNCTCHVSPDFCVIHSFDPNPRIEADAALTDAARQLREYGHRRPRTIRRLRYLSKYETKVVVKKWVIEFGGPKTVGPGERIELIGGPQVAMFRPMLFTLSTSPRSLLTVELRISSEVFPLGCNDVWPKAPGQSVSAFVHLLIGAPTMNQAKNNSAQVFITNRGKKLPRTFTAEIHGVFA